MELICALLMFNGLTWGQNCRDWNSYLNDNNVHLGIAIGMKHIWGGINTQTSYFVDTLHIMTERQTWIPDGTTSVELKDGINAICKQPENGNLHLYQAMLLFIVKVNGMGPADWETAIAAIRKSMAR